jgi:hypothetical protein
MVSEAVANPCLAEFLRRPGDGSRVGVSRETNRHHMGPTPKALIAAARRATTALRDDQAARRNQEARNICGLGDPSIADYGAARAAIAKAIRANVVALALVTNADVRRTLALCTQELCNALLSEPGPATAHVWWADL